jgi:hypothetical protein
MKVLISCTKNPKKFIEVQDELELFIDKKVIFDIKKISVRLLSAVNFFSVQPRDFSFSGLGFLNLT